MVSSLDLGRTHREGGHGVVSSLDLGRTHREGGHGVGVLPVPVEEEAADGVHEGVDQPKDLRRSRATGYLVTGGAFDVDTR